MNLDQNFWNDRYLNGDTGWDLGEISPPMKAYFDQLKNKEIRILIPGGGNSYEAQYLIEKGFKNITVVDLSPKAKEDFLKRFPSMPPEQFIVGDFFELRDQFDLIIEQTFFCALDPKLRSTYASQCKQLLRPGGKICGLMFNVPLNADRPPFGGSKEEYEQLFSEDFSITSLSECYNSHSSRAGKELWVSFLNSK